MPLWNEKSTGIKIRGRMLEEDGVWRQISPVLTFLNYMVQMVKVTSVFDNCQFVHSSQLRISGIFKRWPCTYIFITRAFTHEGGYRHINFCSGKWHQGTWVYWPFAPIDLTAIRLNFKFLKHLHKMIFVLRLTKLSYIISLLVSIWRTWCLNSYRVNS